MEDEKINIGLIQSNWSNAHFCAEIKNFPFKLTCVDFYNNEKKFSVETCR